MFFFFWGDGLQHWLPPSAGQARPIARHAGGRGTILLILLSISPRLAPKGRTVLQTQTNSQERSVRESLRGFGDVFPVRPVLINIPLLVLFFVRGGISGDEKFVWKKFVEEILGNYFLFF